MIRGFMGAVAAIAALLGLMLLKRCRVEGRSMLRAFESGDRLLVESLTYRLRPPRIGEAVLVSWPYALARRKDDAVVDIKRVTAGPGQRATLPEGARVLGADEWYLLGDNLSESTDSRQLGPVRRRDLLGRVWFKY